MSERAGKEDRLVDGIHEEADWLSGLKIGSILVFDLPKDDFRRSSEVRKGCEGKAPKTLAEIKVTSVDEEKVSFEIVREFGVEESSGTFAIPVAHLRRLFLQNFVRIPLGAEAAAQIWAEGDEYRGRQSEDNRVKDTDEIIRSLLEEIRMRLPEVSKGPLAEY